LQQTACPWRTLEGHTHPVSAVAVLADGSRALSGSSGPDAAAVGSGDRRDPAHSYRAHESGHRSGGAGRRQPRTLLRRSPRLRGALSSSARTAPGSTAKSCGITAAGIGPIDHDELRPRRACHIQRHLLRRRSG